MFNRKKEIKKDRFIVKAEQLISSGLISVIVDSETGVNYIVTGCDDSMRITPLIDRNGKVKIDDIDTCETNDTVTDTTTM